MGLKDAAKEVRLLKEEERIEVAAKRDWFAAVYCADKDAEDDPPVQQQSAHGDHKLLGRYSVDMIGEYLNLATTKDGMAKGVYRLRDSDTQTFLDDDL